MKTKYKETGWWRAGGEHRDVLRSQPCPPKTFTAGRIRRADSDNASGTLQLTLG